MSAAAAQRHAASFWVAFAALLAAAGYLRFSAIGWGAPFVYHPDEHFVLQPALDIARTGDPNPHFFQYPSLLIYLEAALIRLLQPFIGASLQSNYLTNGIGPFDALPAQWPFVLAGRLLVASSAVAGILLLLRVVTRIEGLAAGVVAAAFLTVSFLHNQSSHYLTTDVPSTTLAIACMALSLGSCPRWLLAGFVAGLAAGTKYTAGIVVLVPVLAAAELSSETLSRWTRIFLGAVAGFLLSTPYALLDAPNFWDGLMAQRQNYMAWQGQQGNLEWYLAYLYDVGLTPAIATLAVLGLLVGVARTFQTLRRRQSPGRWLAVVLPPLLYVPWIASYPSRAERNLMLVLPFLCLWAASGLRWLCGWVRPIWMGHVALAGGAGVAFFLALPLSSDFNQRLQRPDTRTQALEWIRANLPPGSAIAREEYTPQVQKGDYDVTYLFSLSRRPYSYYLEQRLQYLVASSDIYERTINPPHLGGAAAREFYRVLFGLPLVHEVPEGPFTQGPTIRIYRVPLAELPPE